MTVEITLNGHKVKVPAGPLTYEDVVALVEGEEHRSRHLSITWARPHGGPRGILWPGHSIQATEGTRINAYDTGSA